MGFLGAASGKKLTCESRRHKRCGFDPSVRKILWRGASNPLQYSRVEKPMNREAWQATVHSAAKVRHN